MKLYTISYVYVCLTLICVPDKTSVNRGQGVFVLDTGVIGFMCILMRSRWV